MRPRGIRIICMALLLLCFRPESEDADAAGPDRAELEVTECRVLFPERVLLASEQMGILSEVLDEGTPVQQGQIVARLQDDVPRAAVAVAEARAGSDVAVRVAQKEQEQAQAEYDSALRANQNQPTYPETEITRRRLAAEAATLGIEKAAQDLEISRKQRDEAMAELQSSYLRSPIDGMVTLRIKHVGEGIRQADPVVEVVNTDIVHVEGFVTLNEVHQWRVGRPVEVYADLSPAENLRPGPLTTAARREAGPYSGVIGFVDVSIEPLSRTVRVWAAVPNADGQLKDGMTARMVLVE
jgi:biotin carboxyl carrier protein